MCSPFSAEKMDDTALLTFEDCDRIVRQQLDNATIVNFEVTSSPSQNYSIKVKVSHDGRTKVLTFFGKRTEKIPKMNEILYEDFKKVIPQFEPGITPQLYLKKEDFLIFEDLEVQGFHTCDPKSGLLSLNHIRVVLHVLAKFHAACFAFEETKSKATHKIFTLESDYLVDYSNVFLQKDEVVSVVSSLLDNTEDDFSRTMKDLEERQHSSKFRRTLCHGRLTSKNIMFKCAKGVPEECKLTNFRPNYYASPVCDVLQLIFFNTSEDLRRHHFESLLHHYHKCLKKELEKYRTDVDKILSINDLQVAVHHFLPLIKLETVLLMQEKRCQGKLVAEAEQALKEVLTCSLLSREDCYVIVKNKMGTTSYELESFEVTTLRDVSGFLGEYHRLQIKVIHLSEEKTINCFVKCTPKGRTPQDIARDLDSFSREVFMYQILVPQMQKHGIDTINECIPACYFQRHDDCIVFEDMSLLNYRNLSALSPLDFSMLIMVTRKFAKFHASSLVLEEKMSKEGGKPYRLIDAYSDYFKETLFFEDTKHLGARQIAAGIKSIHDAIDLFPELQTKTNKDNFQKFWPTFKKLFYSVGKTSDRYRNVLSHGDLWTSNLLVHFDETDKPDDCVLIDFQIVRYCPPGYDLLSILHLTTDRATRLKHETELLQIYYDELSRVLLLYGYRVDDIYPFEDFLGCVKYMKPLMVLHAAMECVLTMCTPEEINSFLTNDEVCRRVFFEDRKEFMVAMCQKSTRYKTRLRECILDVYDYCNSMSS
jgi:thiamine kinase-like enzyme